MHGGRPAALPGYRLKYLDGNCLAASEHRLKPLRPTAAGLLPGKSLAVFDPQLGLAVDDFPCADGRFLARLREEGSCWNRVTGNGRRETEIGPLHQRPVVSLTGNRSSKGERHAD